MHYCYYDSPLGRLLLTEEGGFLTGLRMDGAAPKNALPVLSPVLARTEKWLNRYFCGENPTMDIPLSLAGTPFQRQVWSILLTIPYGQTRTYGEIAGLLGRETMSAQAIGGARKHASDRRQGPLHQGNPRHSLRRRVQGSADLDGQGI